MTTVRTRCDKLLLEIGLEKGTSLLSDVQAIASKLGVEFTAIGPTLSACEATHMKTESDAQDPLAGARDSTPSTASKRKAAVVDLTQSDSDGESSKQKSARVDSTQDDLAQKKGAQDVAPSDAVPPWETAEWKASRAEMKEREENLRALIKRCGNSCGNGFGDLVVDETEEEKWREIHDPEGAHRMFLRRFIATQDSKKIARLYESEDDYIEEQVAEWRREHRA